MRGTYGHRRFTRHTHTGPRGPFPVRAVPVPAAHFFARARGGAPRASSRGAALGVSCVCARRVCGPGLVPRYRRGTAEYVAHVRV
eukprot:scaffold77481_cov64-Phaeocystis_antarctica.AAC.2